MDRIRAAAGFALLLGLGVAACSTDKHAAATNPDAGSESDGGASAGGAVASSGAGGRASSEGGAPDGAGGSSMGGSSTSSGGKGSSQGGSSTSSGGKGSSQGGSPAAGAGGKASSGGTTGAGGNSASAGAGGNGTGGAAGAGCDAPGLTWKTANKTNYTSYPDPGSEECIKYNGCTWAGQFAGCNGTKPEAWVSAHNIVAAFPDFNALKLHDLCLRKGSKTIVVTVLDTCGDSDCSGCCTANKGDADELIDVESYTDARWGVADGRIEWADLGPTTGGGCN
jgi:hypothetical protein